VSSADIRYQQRAIVEHFDEAGLAAFRRRIAIAIRIAWLDITANGDCSMNART